MKTIKDLLNMQQELQYYINFYLFLSKCKTKTKIYFFLKSFVKEDKINQEKIHRYIYSMDYDSLLNIMREINYNIETQKRWNLNNAQNFFENFIEKMLNIK